MCLPPESESGSVWCTCEEIAIRSLMMEELVMTLPGNQGKERGFQAILRVISYIQFLQNRIHETQSNLAPHSGHQGFLPLWIPKGSVDVTSKHKKVRRWRPRGCEAKPKLPSRQIYRQTLVPYVSSSSSDNGDGSPWLVSVTPGSPPSPCIPQASLAAALELSPLLLSSPADYLPQALFEEMEIDSWASEDVQDPVLAPAFSLDHSYLSSDKSHTLPLLPTKKTPQVPPESALRTCIHVHGNKSKAKRLQGHSSISCNVTAASPGHNPGKTIAPKQRKLSRLQQIRKKCVNGFIMFCRLNRRPYLSAHPGKASTAATKDLAELWRLMSARERRPYCIKALQFSLLHDRLVKGGSSRLSHENVSPPKPVSVLLAEKAAQSQEAIQP
ncbi:meiosis initiator protein isoform 2-T2 [Anomaloglossus baeobatrachus]